MSSENFVIIGRFGKTHGVHGHISVHSFTDPEDNIFDYLPWFIEKSGQWQQATISHTRLLQNKLLVKLENIDTPEDAKLLTNRHIAVSREQLPELAKDQHYWADLEGLTVKTIQGVTLGVVDYLFDSGAHPIMVVKSENSILIPYIKSRYIIDVDLAAKVVTVDWEPDF